MEDRGIAGNREILEYLTRVMRSTEQEVQSAINARREIIGGKCLPVFGAQLGTPAACDLLGRRKFY